MSASSGIRSTRPPEDRDGHPAFWAADNGLRPPARGAARKPRAALNNKTTPIHRRQTSTCQLFCPYSSPCARDVCDLVFRTNANAQRAGRKGRSSPQTTTPGGNPPGVSSRRGRRTPKAINAPRTARRQRAFVRHGRSETEPLPSSDDGPRRPPSPPPLSSPSQAD